MINIKKRIIQFIDFQIEKKECLKIFLRKTKIRDNREKNSLHRVVFVNNKRPDDYVGQNALEYADNKMVTSKYTFWNFIPKNLYEQFRRVANLYFLFSCTILFFVPDPPVNPIPNVIPFVIVIALTAAKQAYEDIIRHNADWRLNTRKIRVIRNNQFQNINWSSIKCGDIVEVKCDSDFPCDMILLHSKDETGRCFVKTSNLDGETNLKARYVPNNKIPCINNKNDLINLNGVVTCDKPNNRLYEFSGTLQIDNNTYLVTNENILLRGTTLKVASCIYGCAIYTGKDTKMMLNLKIKSNKLSSVEKNLNYFMLFCVALLILITVTCLVGSLFYQEIYNNSWYLLGRHPPNFKENRAVFNFTTFMFYLNLNYIIPLALYITLELARFIGSKFFEWDLEMYDENTNQPAKANTSDLNENLGQVEYLFTDKTGTLTENEMIFKHFFLDGKIYEELNGNIYEVGNTDDPKQLDDEKLKKFFEILSICHTVQLDCASKSCIDSAEAEFVQVSLDEKYNASSPDELSFIKFCAKLGIHYEGESIDHETNKKLRKVIYKNNSKSYETAETPSIECCYEILQVLEFDPTRKRMSVIIKDCQTGNYALYCKGADCSVFNKATNNFDQDSFNSCLREFSRNGWRTLALSYKNITPEEYFTYERILFDANSDFSDKVSRLADAYEIIEDKLNLIGITAVEDKLQEDVDVTLEALRQAGIIIWVLTGDKLETAVNISESCKHFSEKMIQFVLADMVTSDDISSKLNAIYQEMIMFKHDQYALVIDGSTLSKVFEYNLEIMFRETAMKCKAVLCCRMSPGQKAQIVKLIKESSTKPLCAAIGDGANDVSMLQEAHVGIGIYGKEGRSAARSADYAFSRFKFLKRALLVHGYLYYTRVAILVVYFFYKNFTFQITQFYFAFFCAFSSTSLYPALILSTIHILLTSIPVFLIGLFEQRTSIEELEKNPLYYRTIYKNKLLSFVEFSKWTFYGFWHSAVAYFIPLALFYINEIFFSNGHTGDFSLFGALVFISVDVIIHLKAFIVWNHQDYSTLIAFLFSLISFLFVCILTNSFIIPYPLNTLTDEQTFYFVYYKLFSSSTLWLVIFLCVVIALIPDVMVKFYENLSENRMLQMFKISESTSNGKDNKAKKNYKNQVADVTYLSTRV